MKYRPYNYLRLETFLRAGCVSYSPYVAICVHDRVAASDFATFLLFLTVLVIGEQVVFDVEAELVGGVDLEIN